MTWREILALAAAAALVLLAAGLAERIAHPAAQVPMFQIPLVPKK